MKFKSSPKKPRVLSIDKKPTKYDREYNAVWQRTLAKELSGHTTLLDVGTGNSTVKEVIETTNKEIHVLTCDPNPNTEPTFNTHATGKFDVVTAFDVLDYDPTWRHTLDRLVWCSNKYVVIKGFNYTVGRNLDQDSVIQITPNELVAVCALHGLKFVKGWNKETHGEIPVKAPSEIHFRANNMAEYMAIFKVDTKVKPTLTAACLDLVFTHPDTLPAKLQLVDEDIANEYETYKTIKYSGEL